MMQTPDANASWVQYGLGVSRAWKLACMTARPPPLTPNPMGGLLPSSCLRRCFSTHTSPLLAPPPPPGQGEMIVQGVQLTAPEGDCSGGSTPCWSRLADAAVFVTDTSVRDVAQSPELQQIMAMAGSTMAGVWCGRERGELRETRGGTGKSQHKPLRRTTPTPGPPCNEQVAWTSCSTPPSTPTSAPAAASATSLPPTTYLVPPAALPTAPSPTMEPSLSAVVWVRALAHCQRWSVEVSGT